MKAVRILALAAFAAPAFAQDVTPSQSPASPDEVVVPGRKPEQIRVEIERLENAVYERFNALNSNDDFDIHCFEQAPTGSNIPERKCWPNFALRSEQRAAGASLNRMHGLGGGNSRQERMGLEQKGKELEAEIQRVARADEQLMHDLVRLAELKESQQAANGSAAR
jgi:hypothetical protein